MANYIADWLGFGMDGKSKPKDDGNAGLQEQLESYRKKR